MKPPIPNPWLLLGALLGPAAILTSAQIGGSLLVVLPVVAGASCGLSLLSCSDAKARYRSRTLLAAAALALVCSLTSLTLVFGACASASGTGGSGGSSTPKFARIIAERQTGIPPESDWNRAGLWYRIAESPPTYLPVEYPRHAPRTESEGEWLIDPRDHKELFVPYEGTKIKRTILRAEAMKVTDWEEKR